MPRAALCLLILTACGKAEDTAPPPAEPCGELAPGEVVALATGFAKTEGIAFSPDGRLFASAGDVIAEISPDGSWQVVADLRGGVGLAWRGDRLMAAGYPEDVGSVVSIDVDSGEVTALSQTIDSPNFLAVSPWGTLLVADADAAIWEVQPDGATASWLALPGPNGMAFTEDGATLWVVNTWDDPAPVWQVPVSGGVAGAPIEVTSYASGNFPDGVALGQSGALYVSLNFTGLISAVQPDGAEQTVAEGAAWTASVAFGVGPDFDACALYSTSLFGTEVYAIGIGVPGLPVPY
jgi:sugar lactone lactonase YvrE